MNDTAQDKRVSKAMAQYYEDAPKAPNINDWESWVEVLDEPMKSGFRAIGFEKSKTALPFMRFYLELYDYGVRDYMRKHLSPNDFEYYMKEVETV